MNLSLGGEKMASIIKKLNKQTGVTYVYESESYWDKEKKQPRSKRKLISKIDRQTGEIVLTGGRKGRRKEELTQIWYKSGTGYNRRKGREWPAVFFGNFIIIPVKSCAGSGMNFFHEKRSQNNGQMCLRMSRKNMKKRQKNLRRHRGLSWNLRHSWTIIMKILPCLIQMHRP